MGTEWSLVGRDTELGAIVETLVEGRRSVVLAGAAGVGKSRLASAALDLCRGQGFAVASVTATRASSPIPLGAFAPLLPPRHEPRRGQVDEKASLLHRCAEDLAERAQGRPLVVAADDAHLLDDMSATLVLQLVQTGVAIVVATVRHAEPAPDPVTALWKGDLAERIEIHELDDRSVTAALIEVLEGAIDEASVAELMGRSRGNMLFLRELVHGALADDALRDENGIWRLVGELQPSDRLVELVESRLQGLSDQERDLLEIVALGEPLDATELAGLGDESVAESLERKRLLSSSQDGSRIAVRLGHPMYGDVLRERISAQRHRSIARTLAESAESTGAGRREQLLRIATWRLAGGGAEPGLMHEAAVVARWRYDFRLAERLARAALDAGGGFESALLAAQLAALQGRSTQADAELEALAGAAENAEQSAVIALTRLDNRVIYAGTIETGLEIAEEAEAILPVSEQRDGVAARRAALLLAKEGPARAMEVLRPLLDRAGGAALGWACMPAAYSLARMGRIEEALATARSGYTVQSALEIPTDWYPWMHAFYEAEALSHGGWFGEAGSLARTHYQYGVASRCLEAQAMFSWHLAKTVTDRGHVEESIRHTRKAVSIYRQLGRPQFVEFCLIYQAQAWAVAGRPAEAEEVLHSLVGLGTRPSYFMGIDLLQAEGWVAVAKGDVRGAHQTFVRAGTEGERIGDLVGSLAAFHCAARIGYAKEVESAVTALDGRIEGVLAPVRVSHIHALAQGDPARLERASEDFEGMGALLLAAEAAADAAVRWGRREDPRRGAAAERRAAWLVDRCSGARTPAVRSTESRARLTHAEWETAHLAAAGRTNKEIADLLVVSVRTVENRLQYVYGKLGVRSRSLLPEALETVVAPVPSRSSAVAKR